MTEKSQIYLKTPQYFQLIILYLDMKLFRKNKK